MPRRLLALASMLSLFCCLATVVLWVRSYRPRDAVERFVVQEYENAEWNIDDTFYSFKGLILWVHRRHPDTLGSVKSETTRWHWYNPGLPEDDPEPQQNDLTGVQRLSSRLSLGVSSNLKFDRQELASQWREEGFYVLVPHRIFALALSILPAAFLVVWFRKRRRSPHGRCRSCGYDLTGNTSGRCPECGSAILNETGTKGLVLSGDSDGSGSSRGG